MARAAHLHSVAPSDEWWPSIDPAARRFMDEDLARSGLRAADLGASPVEHAQRRGMPAYIIPYDDTYWRIRFKVPADYPYGKYKAPKNSDSRLYVPRATTLADYRKANTKYICEGEKKAAKLHKQFKHATVGIAGCWMWGHRVRGERTLIPELQDSIKSGDSIVYIADRDILDPKKLDIGKAARSLMHIMQTLMNCNFQVLLPPEPYKGIDDWLADTSRPDLDDLEELDLEGYEWFPLKMLQSIGISFKPDKDGNVLSYKQAIANYLNTELFAQLIYTNNPGIVTLDKYRGYLVRGKEVGASSVIGEMMAGINAYFPEYKLMKEGVQHYLLKYCAEAGAGNCVRDHIENLTWDGRPRLDDWLPQTMRLGDGMDKGFAEQVGRALICAMYSRIMNPGVQQDFMFILVGDQGIGKSQFFRTLGNFPDHQGYHAVTVTQLGTIDYTMGLALKRAVVLDVDDLENMRRGDQGELKSFITRVTDAWREIYTTRMVEEPRGFVLTGSTNNRKILDDMTGNRRYLTLDVRDIRNVKGEFAWCERLRDQLLAECHERWAELKDTWWNIDIQVINANNSTFAVDDPVLGAVAEMVENDKLIVSPKGERYITPTGISRWLNDPRLTTTSIGIKLSRVAFTKLGTFEIGNRVSMRTAVLDDQSDEIQRLYRPQNKVERTWVYSIKSFQTPTTLAQPSKPLKSRK